jgi:hypothetical protein
MKSTVRLYRLCIVHTVLRRTRFWKSAQPTGMQAMLIGGRSSEALPEAKSNTLLPRSSLRSHIWKQHDRCFEWENYLRFSSVSLRICAATARPVHVK